MRIHRQRALQQPDRGLAGKDLLGAFSVAGRHNDFGEYLRDLFGQGDADGPVRRDNPAESGHRIACVRLAMSIGNVAADGQAAWVRVLDDGHAWLVEITHGAPGRLRVGVVVERHRLAVQLPGTREPRPAVIRHIQRGPLVGVLAVAQDLRPPPDRRYRVRPARLAGDLIGRQNTGEPRRDRDVVRGGVREGAGGKPAPRRELETTSPDRGDQLRIVRRGDDHGHGVMVLRRGANHRRPADIDLFDRLVLGCAARDRFPERIEVRHNEVERLNVEFRERLGVLDVAQISEEAGMHAWMQCLDPSAEDLGETGEGAYGRHSQAMASEHLCGGSGGDDLHPGIGERVREVRQAGLVVDADQNTVDGTPAGGDQRPAG